MNQSEPVHYEIRFRGEVDPRWAAWFEGFELVAMANGVTLLSGPIRDQSELRGVLEKIANLNLHLVSVNPREREER